MALTVTELAAPLLKRNGNALVKLLVETVASQVKMLAADGETPSDVQTEIETLRSNLAGLLSSNSAMTFAGTLTGTAPNVLPSTDYAVGQVWYVSTAGTYAGQVCEVGDLVICTNSYEAGTASNADFTVAQTNIDGAVVGPASATDEDIALFDGTTGKLIKGAGITKTQLEEDMAKVWVTSSVGVPDTMPEGLVDGGLLIVEPVESGS